MKYQNSLISIELQVSISCPAMEEYFTSSVPSTYGGGGLAGLELSTIELSSFKSKSSNQSGLPHFHLSFQLTAHGHLIHTCPLLYSLLLPYLTRPKRETGKRN